MISPVPVTRLGAQHAAQRELSKAIYRRDGDPLAVRVVRAIGRFIDHILNRASGGGVSGTAGAVALVVLLGLVVVVVFWRVGPPRRARAAGAVLGMGRADSAADYRLRSELAAADSDWHTAVVERMRAVARELEERGVLEARSGRTATELAREAGQRVPTAATELRLATDTFNAIAYGGELAGPADLEVMNAADEAVQRSARSLVHTS